jgi:hypothetical protein
MYVELGHDEMYVELGHDEMYVELGHDEMYVELGHDEMYVELGQEESLHISSGVFCIFSIELFGNIPLSFCQCIYATQFESHYTNFKDSLQKRSCTDVELILQLSTFTFYE